MPVTYLKFSIFFIFGRELVWSKSNIRQTVSFLEDPKCANGSNFCQNFEFYPYQKIEEILKVHNLKKDFFVYDQHDGLSSANRHAVIEEDTNFCRAKQMVVSPQLAKNVKNQWRIIVNQRSKNGYAQGVLIETCLNAGGACEMIGSLPDGYKAFCKQKYYFRRLYSVDEDWEPLPETFKFPSACCCVYKVDTRFLANFYKTDSLSTESDG